MGITMTEFTAFNRDKEGGEIFMQHRVELMYAGDDIQKHMLDWVNNGYGGDTIQEIDEDLPGFAMSKGGEHVDFDYELFIVERYGAEVPESISVNFALKQMKHIGNSIEDHFTGASTIDVFSKFFCDRPVLPPKEMMEVVEDPSSELEFKEVED